jgi:homoserine O-acetyltransferase
MRILDLSLRILDLRVRILNLSLRILDLSLRILNLRMRILDLSLRILDLRMHILDLRLRILNLRMHILDLSLRILDLRVRILDSRLRIDQFCKHRRPFLALHFAAMRNFATLALLLVAVAAYGQAPKAVEADFVVKDFHFRSGEVLPEARIHYATIGTLRKSEHGTNAVLVLHGTGGSLQQFLNDRFAGVLLAPGGVLDASRYFIVIPDNIGHGKSSKPSDGLRAKFPHYDYDDMIELQHRLLAEGLGFDHLHLVMGTSMGGMHTWMWGERWPEAADALVPLASAPAQIAGRNRIWRKMMIDDLQRNDLTAAVQILVLAGSAPLQWQKSAPTRDDADRWIGEQMKTRLATNDADDLLYAIESSRNYDPSPQLERITAPLLAINSADDFINPPELGIMETAIKRVKRGRYLLLPVSENTHGHSTHTWAAVWEKPFRKFLEAVAR